MRFSWGSVHTRRRWLCRLGPHPDGSVVARMRRTLASCDGSVCHVTGMVLGDRAYVYSTSLPESPSDDDESHSLAYAPLLASANAIAFPATVSAGFGAPVCLTCAARLTSKWHCCLSCSPSQCFTMWRLTLQTSCRLEMGYVDFTLFFSCLSTCRCEWFVVPSTGPEHFWL